MEDLDLLHPTIKGFAKPSVKYSVVMIPLGLLLLLVCTSRAWTLAEVRRQGNQQLLSYNDGIFDVGFHAGMACLVVYGVLLTSVTMVPIVIKQLVEVGRVPPRRKR